MNVVYKLSFINRINAKTPPYYYIGSKTNCTFDGTNIIDKNGKFYYSSSSSSEFQKALLKETPKVEILYFQLVGDEQITSIEAEFQKNIEKDVWNKEYFNLAYADGQFTTYGVSPSKETREKQSITMIKRNRNKGKNHGFYGKHHTNLARKKISEASKKYWKENPHRGFSHTKEAKIKIGISSSIRHKGSGNPMYGVKPWKTPNAIKSGTCILWLKYAEILYDYLGPDFKSKSSIFVDLNLPKFRIDNFIKRFKMGWNPYLDEEFQKDKLELCL